MVITIPAQARPLSGPRPININRDVPQVIRLLELTFQHRLSGNGQRLFNSETGLIQPAFLGRFTPMAGKLALGYVWEENGRIVGNASLVPTHISGHYLIVNVAVHPDYRRRGIARSLMTSLLDLLRERNGSQALLQVVKDNTAALTLYQSMQFNTLGSTTTWHSTSASVRAIMPDMNNQTNPVTRKLSRHEWQAAYQLDIASLPPELNWPEPPAHSTYKSGFWQQLDNFINGRSTESWVTVDEQDRLTGIITISSGWERPYQISLRVHPTKKGQLERPLLATIIHRLRRLPHHNIRLNHPDDDEFVNQLLSEANFQPRRTLVHMRLNIS